MSKDYGPAAEHFVPSSFMFFSNACAAIVLHKTGGDATPQAVYRTFLASGNPGRSVHYAVGQDGSVWQFVPESLGAGGNGAVEPGYDPFWTPFVERYGNLNLCTLSIEHCDPAPDNSTPLTLAQADASFKLIAHLAQRWRIPLSHIKGHNSIDPISRARCPGNYPWTALMNYLRAQQQQGGNNMNIPAGWQDDGKTLTAPNGIAVVRGFRDYLLARQWDPGNLPLAAEAGRTPLEDSNPTLGGGSWQPFRQNVLEWTPAKGVFEMWTGQELLHARSQTQPLPPVTPAINLSEVLATARLISETAQHLLTELQPPAPGKPV